LETEVLSKLNRFEPELADHFLTFDVNMHRLIAVEAIEEKTVRTGNPFDSGHRGRVYYTSSDHRLHLFGLRFKGLDFPGGEGL
jgi:hypothetical protein